MYSKKLLVSLSLVGAILAVGGGVYLAHAALTFSDTSITGDSSSVIDATGTISIGASTATGITIGRSGITATFPGTVTITGATTSLQNLVVSGSCTGCGIGNFTAGGDLSGSSTSQTVIGLQGHQVSSTNPTPNQVLMWNGTFWTPANVSSTGGITSINGLLNSTTSIVGAGTVTVSTSSPNTITITGTGSGAITIDGLTTSTFQITGTANQITVTTSSNIISLSLPQNIGTASTPTFGGLAVNGNATTTGNLTVLGSLLDAGGNRYVTSTASGAATTTINGILGPTFTLASSTYLGITPSGSTLTFMNLGVTSTAGNWMGTWQLKNPSDFLASSTAYVATTSGNWTGTWQNATSGTYYPYSNPLGFATSTAGSISSSSAISANNFPFWANTTGGLSGTSTLSMSGTTITQANAFNIGGNLNVTGTATFASTLSQSGGLVALASTTINGNATTTGTLVVLGSLLDAGGNRYVTSTLGGAITTSSAVTAFNVPYWASTASLAGTSTIFFAPSTGYIGIGTATPQGLLDIVGNSNSTSTAFTGARTISIINTDQTNGDMNGFDFRTLDASGTLTTGAKILTIYQNHASSGISADLDFRTNSSGTIASRLYITSAGAVTIPALATAGSNYLTVNASGTIATTTASSGSGERVTWVFCAAAACSTSDAIANPWIAGATESVQKCYISAGTPPTGTGGVTVQVLENGSNLFSVTLPSGVAALTTVTSTPAGSVVEGDNLTAAITAVGGTNPGANVTMSCKLQ
jgi:hypothetical protein